MAIIALDFDPQFSSKSPPKKQFLKYWMWDDETYIESSFRKKIRYPLGKDSKWEAENLQKGKILCQFWLRTPIQNFKGKFQYLLNIVLIDN